MAIGFRQILPFILRLAKPAATGTPLPGNYYFASLDRPALGAMALTSLLNDGAVGDTSTSEAGAATSVYSGACAHLTLTLYVTSLVDLGALYNLTSWSAQAKVEDAAAEVPACTVPPEEEYAPDNGWWLEYSTDGSTWSAGASGTFTGSAYNSLGGSLAVSARYVRLVQRIHHDSQRATGPTIYARCADFRLYGTGTGAPTTDVGEIQSYGFCENDRATIWILESIPLAAYYTIYRVSDVEPLPGTLVYSGIAPVAASRFSDYPLPIGRAVTYLIRGCNTNGCGPASTITLTPCYESGSLGACECEETEGDHVIVEPTRSPRTNSDAARRRGCG